LADVSGSMCALFIQGKLEAGREFSRVSPWTSFAVSNCIGLFFYGEVQKPKAF